MRTVVVEVTAEDIEKGEKEECERCPIACALLRSAGTARAFVDGSEMAAGDWEGMFPEIAQRVPMPPDAAEFVADFDEGRIVEPFTFTVELP